MATTSSLKTVRDLLRLAVSRFTAAKLSFGHGSANAYDEAAYLVLHTLNLPLDTLDPFLDARLLPEEIDAVLKVIDRRVTERVPAAYITHEAFMHGLRFYVDSRVIVPRSFIGELLQDGLEPWIGDTGQIGPVLELCTGSGCLPIIAAHVWPNARIDAVDISSDALAVARRNVADYKMEDRITLYEGDLYAPLPSAATYDVILTNPPYVNEQSMRDLPPDHGGAAHCAGRRRRRHGRCAPDHRRREETPEPGRRWWWKSATSARTSKRPSRSRHRLAVGQRRRRPGVPCHLRGTAGLSRKGIVVIHGTEQNWLHRRPR
jgi:ribosomal protein L3 glutamine methyltransferase